VHVAIGADDERPFVASVERYRRELQLHCYRMLGSVEDSEDLVQETLLRAWRKRDEFEGPVGTSSMAVPHRDERLPRRAAPTAAPRAADRCRAGGRSPSAAALAREASVARPYPERLLEAIASGEEEPEEAVVRKETIELAFLAAIQHLPPRRRAVLILRDVLGWSARDTAATLGISVNAVNSSGAARPLDPWRPAAPAPERMGAARSEQHRACPVAALHDRPRAGRRRRPGAPAAR
jgi:RNA polymerase sigma-70 factor, ECF subfamily